MRSVRFCSSYRYGNKDGKILFHVIKMYDNIHSLQNSIYRDNNG